MRERVLVISPEVLLPTNAGGRAAVLAQCVALRGAGFAVDLLAFHREPVSEADARRHEEIADHVGFIRRQSLVSASLTAPLLPYQVSGRRVRRSTRRSIERHLPRPDLIVAQQEWTVPAAAGLWRDDPVPILLSSHNDELAYYRDQWRAARGVRRKYLRMELLRMRPALRACIATASSVVTLAEQDAKAYGTRPVWTIPHPLPDHGGAIRHRRGGRSVLFLGALDMPHAVEGLLWFVREVWPVVLARVPDARFDIAGRRASAALRDELASAQNVDFHGEVLDPGPLYAAADVFVNPVFLGSGVNIKLADPIGLGIPSVTTTTGSRGYESLGDALVIADEPTLFAAACATLLSEPRSAAEISTRLHARAPESHLSAITAQWRVAALAAMALSSDQRRTTEHRDR